MAVLETVVSRPSGFLPSSHSQVGSLFVRLSFSDDPKLKRRLFGEVELPFVQAFEQRGGGFVGKVRQLAFVGECGNFAGNLRQFSNAHTAWFHRMLGGKLAECFWAGGALRRCSRSCFQGQAKSRRRHADIDHQQIVVGYDDIDGLQRVAGKVKQAFRSVGTGGFEAARSCRCSPSSRWCRRFSGQVSRSPLNRRAENSSAVA